MENPSHPLHKESLDLALRLPQRIQPLQADVLVQSAACGGHVSATAERESHGGAEMVLVLEGSSPLRVMRQMCEGCRAAQAHGLLGAT